MELAIYKISITRQSGVGFASRDTPLSERASAAVSLVADARLAGYGQPILKCSKQNTRAKTTRARNAIKLFEFAQPQKNFPIFDLPIHKLHVTSWIARIDPHGLNFVEVLNGLSSV